MNSPFKLLIYAIVFLALLFIVYGVFDFGGPESFTSELKKGLTIANTQDYLGQYFEIGERVIPEGTIVSKNSFDILEKSIALECTSEDKCCPRGEICSKDIEWDYDRIKFKNTVTADVSVRCLRYEGVPVCRFYFGKIPAQAQIEDITLIAQNEKSASLKIDVKNVGFQPLLIGNLNLTLRKDVKGDWADTEIELEPKELETLAIGAGHAFFWDVEFITGGKYRLDFTFEGSNAGFDTKGLELDVNTNLEACDIDRRDPETVSVIDSNMFREIHYCTGCGTAHECLTAWNRIYPEFDFDMLTKDSVYCLKDDFDEYCG